MTLSYLDHLLASPFVFVMQMLHEQRQKIATYIDLYMWLIECDKNMKTIYIFSCDNGEE